MRSSTYFRRGIRWFLLVITSLLTLLVGGFFVFILATDGSSAYKGKIEDCLAKRKAGTAKSITEYVCPEGKVQNEFDVAYQVVLDSEFKKLDKEVKQAIKGFQWQKVKQSTDVSKQLVEWFDETGPNPEKSFTAKYRGICEDLQKEGNPLAEVVKSYEGGVTTDGAAQEFLFGNASCNALVDQKMKAYRDIGYLVGVKNMSQTAVEDKAEFVGVINEQYEKFLLQWTTYIAELARIKSKWNIKTRIQNGSG